ncbi:uncharacterized protein LOC126694707 isoform X2 [Quercus robur]|uniref:uncharacterized protein LOC126694707 isoform X2 n=1 Tax=Quercus robur TaxID=38942 RepID=UPI0021634A91|nr:uncharacterized protein LOC126694707 isoform X2 [Quercus robur]
MNLSRYGSIEAPGCSFVLFFGFESKEIALSFCVFGNVETLELLLILSTRSALSALVFQGPASKSRSKLWDIVAVYAWIDRDVGYFVKLAVVRSRKLL